MSTKPPTLAETLSRFEALSTEHSALVAEIEALNREIADARSTARATRDAAIQAVRSWGEHADETARQRHAADEAQRALVDLEQRLNALTTRRDDVFNERYNLRAPATLAEIRAHQEHLVVARAEVANLEARLAAVNATPAPESPDLEAIEAELSEALVKVELGEAAPSILKDLEARRDKARHALEAAHAERSRAELFRRGLETRLAGARAEVERLESAHKVALSWHLLAELEAVGTEYRAAADQLHTAYERLHGLSRTLALVDRIRGRGVDMTSDDTLELPRPRLDSVRDMPRHRDSREARQRAAQLERERLASAGIELPA